MAKKIKKVAKKPLPVKKDKKVLVIEAPIKTIIESVKAAIQDKPIPKVVREVVPVPAVELVAPPVPDVEEPVSAPVLPVESDKPGVARHPKPKKVAPPLKFDSDKSQDARISVLEKHLAQLLDRLSAEHGGVHSVAAEALREETAKVNAK